MLGNFPLGGIIEDKHVDIEETGGSMDEEAANILPPLDGSIFSFGSILCFRFVVIILSNALS